MTATVGLATGFQQSSRQSLVEDTVTAFQIELVDQNTSI